MRHALTALAFALPLPAVAQGPAIVGPMSGTLEGSEVSYVIMDGENADTSWQEMDEGIEVSLTAYPADSPMDDANVVTLTFVGDTATRTPEFLSGVMTLNRDGETLTATSEALDLRLESMEVSGDSLLLIGTFLGQLSAGDESLTAASENATTLSGSIQATVIRSPEQDGSTDQ